MSGVSMLLDGLEPFVVAAKVERLSSDQRSRLHNALGAACDRLRSYIDTHRNGDGYDREKVHNFEWSINSILGFDPGNGHSHEQHRVWAMGELDTLRNRMETAE